MAYTTNQLISGAYYASGIVSKEFETVTGAQIDEALVWVNEIISKKVVQSDLIPYEGQSTFTAVVGQEEYSIPNLIKVDTLTFLKESVRYAMTLIPRNQYQGNPRVQTITSLPYQYLYERELGGCKIFLYFLPDQPYEFTITGVFRLADIALGQDLELTLENFYIAYLRYALADKICHEYSMPVPDGVRSELAEYEALISKNSKKLDMAIVKNSTLHKRKRPGWAYINLGEGYLP